MKDRRIRYDAVVAGYLDVDIAPIFPEKNARPMSELFRPGSVLETEGLSISLGGVVPNTGLAMHMFGKRVALNALVGKDVVGDLIMNMLSKHDVALDIHRTDAVETAYSIVLAPPGSDRMFILSPGANALFSVSDVDYDIVGASRIFHFGYPPLMNKMFADNGAELEKVLARARESGAAVSLDMTVPDPNSPSGKADWPAVLEKALPHVDIFVPSIEELLYMLDLERYKKILSEAGNEDMVDYVPDGVYSELAARAIAHGVSVVMIKAGHRGAYLKTENMEKLNNTSLGPVADNWSDIDAWAPVCPADPGRIKNACGAGDAAVAAFLSAMLDGEPAERAASMAMRAGRDNLYGADSLSGLSDWSEMLNADH